MPLAVSIIIPAHNAATTLAETLASVQAQTHRGWEAIVVENGSSDSTLALAEQFAEHDPRIRVIRSPQRGVSRARNLGLAHARHDWILFLDADDWILPEHLARLTATLAADPALDAVHCGWSRVSPEGVTMFEDFGPADRDLFPQLGRNCQFAIHACVVRRASVLAAGGFDESLRTCEDWDLWARLARAGAQFALRRELLAVYRARPLSASMDGRQMLADGFVVIARGHAPDPRVPTPVPRHAQGLPASSLPAARLENLIWQAGLMLGSGLEATGLLEAIADDPPATVPTETAAITLFSAALLPTARPPVAWHRLLAWITPQLERFVQRLETHTRQPGLARSIVANLERRAVSAQGVPLPLAVGRTQGIVLELTAPFPALDLPPPTERLYCRLEFEGHVIGGIDLPIFDGHVAADLLADAVVANHAWPILGRFFARTLYPQLERERDAQGWTVRRHGTVLARGLPGAADVAWETAHDRIGWGLFMQEAWGLTAAPDGRFYHLGGAERRRETASHRRRAADWLVIDLLDEIRGRSLAAPAVDLVLTVAGLPVARAPLIVPRRVLSAATTRAALSLESGFELCRACVREALLQRPVGPADSLRARLAEVRAQRLQARPAPAPTLPDGFMPGAVAFFPPFEHNSAERVLWPRHPQAPCGTSASRRAALPASVLGDLKRLIDAGGEALITCHSVKGTGRALRYVPELLWRSPGVLPGASNPPFAPAAAHPPHHRALDLLPSRRFREALELACADGHLTPQLASRVKRLVATDSSRVALEQTRRLCASHANVEFRELDPVYDPLPGERFDLIVFRDIPDYARSQAALEVMVDKLATALEPGGYFVCVQSPSPAALADIGPDAGDDDPELAGRVFRAAGRLELLDEVRAPSCRVQLYQRPARWLQWLGRSAPYVKWIADRTPAAAANALRRQPDRGATPATPTESTARLPILMYHRIATEGPAALSRYRVAPEAFEEQLRWLRDRGYQNATLEEWRAAREVKRPLPGRRVLLTFDDGCTDFADVAWPLLQRYGFRAIMFLPTAEIGGACRWDAHLGEPAAIMDWATLRALRDAGLEIGSHTATHPLLPGISPEAMAGEAVRSRAAIAQELGVNATSIAYPFGGYDPVVEAVFGAAGYLYGLTCDPRGSEPGDRLLALPRIEVPGGATIEEFSRLLAQ